jgi:antitoxin component YwqK of YwqJK toxin-antitoxin module
MEWLKHFTICRLDGCVLVNDWKQGTEYVGCYEDKILYHEWKYINNKLNGSRYSWYSNGILLYKDTYVNNSPRGIQYLYDRFGNLISEYHYI